MAPSFDILRAEVLRFTSASSGGRRPGFASPRELVVRRFMTPRPLVELSAVLSRSIWIFVVLVILSFQQPTFQKFSKNK